MIRLPILIGLFALIGLTVIAGCTYPEASQNTVEFSGDIVRVDGQFRMTGYVHVAGTNSGNFDEVAVVLYNQNQTVIERVPLGSISSHSEGPNPTMLTVNVTSDRLPSYVIIESPDIWNPKILGDRVHSEGFRWTEYGYQQYWVGHRGERFPSG